MCMYVYGVCVRVRVLYLRLLHPLQALPSKTWLLRIWCTGSTRQHQRTSSTEDWFENYVLHLHADGDLLGV